MAHYLPPSINHYCSYEDVERQLELTFTADQAEVAHVVICGVSRDIENFTGRKFYTRTETRYYDGGFGRRMLLDEDLLTVTSLTVDNDADGTYDDETWVEDTDFWLTPFNSWPKNAIEVHPEGNFSLSQIRKGYKIAGIWGYGNGLEETPWQDAGVTVTFADGTTNTGTVSEAGVLETGQTLLVGTEQIFIGSISGSNLNNCRRAANGTTGAAHTDAACQIARYPSAIRKACIFFSCQAFNTMAHAGMQAESIGDYSYTASTGGNMQMLMEQLIGTYRRLVVA